MPLLQTSLYKLHHQQWKPEKPSKEALFFLHDGLGSLESWKTFPKELSLALNMPAFAYDRWGYGKTESRPFFQAGFMEEEAMVFLELLDKLEISQAHMVGHSDGASIALLVAFLFPKRIKSVVAQAPHTFVEPETTKGIQALLEAVKKQGMPKGLHRLHGEKATSLLKAWSSCWLGELHAKWDIRPLMPLLSHPLLILQGKQDNFGTEAQLLELSKASKAQVRWIENCAHSPHLEHPKLVKNMLLEFYHSLGLGSS